MTVPLVTFQYRILKVFYVVYVQANRDCQKIITQIFGPSRPPTPLWPKSQKLACYAGSNCQWNP